MAELPFDTVLEGGLVFDGGGGPGRVASVAIAGGRVAEVSAHPNPHDRAAEVVDARGLWVTPGFLDLHTHYDAEVEVAPALSESLRHGVTSVVLGSCSLSLAIGTPEDLADMFCRVEAIPYDVVRPLLEDKKSWETLPEYLAHLDSLALGPNVATFLGPSAIAEGRSRRSCATPTSSSASRTRARTSATWRITTSRSACSGSCATPSGAARR